MPRYEHFDQSNVAVQLLLEEPTGTGLLLRAKHLTMIKNNNDTFNSGKQPTTDIEICSNSIDLSITTGGNHFKTFKK